MIKTTKTLGLHESFAAGFAYGKAEMVELSAREISVQFPNVDESAFAQGNIDGMLGDDFRLNLVRRPDLIGGQP